MKRSSRIRLVLSLLAVAGVIVTFLWLLGSGPDAGTDPMPEQSPAATPPPPPMAEEPADTSTVSGDTMGTSPGAPSTELPARPSPAPTFTFPDLPDTLLARMALDSLQLAIPVAGIAPGDLTDTYTDARSEGRVHNAIDIIAPQGTPVIAATDGVVVKLFASELGGITIYQRGSGGRVIYYYAHLDRYADGLAEGDNVRRGEVIGYVGDTGNAGPGNYHLHFAIWIPPDSTRYWDGVSINPYPILRRPATTAATGGNPRGSMQ